jgi:hypothetical protein
VALGTPALATPSVIISAVNVTTASFTPTASALLIVRVGTRHSSLMGDPTISDTAGLAWSLLAAGVHDTGSGTRHKARAWAAIAPASPSSMTVTGSATSTGRMGISVVQVTGFGGLPGNAAAVNSATGDPTIVLGSTPATNSAVIAFLSAAATTSGISPPAGFTELDDVTDGAGLSLHCCYDMTSAPASIAYSTTWNTSVGIAVEVTEASGAGLRIRARSNRFRHMVIR